MLTTFTICIGQMTTKGSVKNAKLPAGPIDTCPVFNVTSDLLMSNMTSNNFTDMYSGTWMNGTTQSVISVTDIPEPYVDLALSTVNVVLRFIDLQE